MYVTCLEQQSFCHALRKNLKFKLLYFQNKECYPAENKQVDGNLYFLLCDEDKNPKLCLVMNFSFLWRHVKTKNIIPPTKSYNAFKFSTAACNPMSLALKGHRPTSNYYTLFFNCDVSLGCLWWTKTWSTSSVIPCESFIVVMVITPVRWTSWNLTLFCKGLRFQYTCWHSIAICLRRKLIRLYFCEEDSYCPANETWELKDWTHGQWKDFVAVAYEWFTRVTERH